MRRNLLTALIAVTCATTAVATTTPAAAAVGLQDPIPAPIPASGIRVGLDVAAAGLVSPVRGVPAPDQSNGLVVIDQGGAIWSVDTGHGDGRDGRSGRPAKRMIGDLSGLLVGNLGKVIEGLAYDERGLLGIAFAPRRDDDSGDDRHARKDHDEEEEHGAGKVYTFENEDATARPDFSTLPANVAADSQLVLRAWSTSGRGHDLKINMNSSRVLLRIDKPQFNHNGGDLAFGPDGMLYMSVGDGGNADDQGPGHVAGGNGQSLAPGNVLGKILRINPRGHNSANGRYGIPADNPFVGRKGADEIWARGFRNPYRMSFDRSTGALTVGDVGQNDIEEFDVVRGGGNYGWPVKEGTFLFDNNGDGNGFVTANSPGSPAGLIDPIAEYDHTAPGGLRCGFPNPPSACQGIAIVGGFVYRGREIDALRGGYVFGDYSRAFAQPLGRLFVARQGKVMHLGIARRNGLGLAVTGWAQDRQGELYVLGNRTGVLSGHSGKVVRLIEPQERDGD